MADTESAVDLDVKQNVEVVDVDNVELDNVELEELDGDHCSICLQEYVDRCVLPDCAHEFCFECILMWTGD